MGVLNVTPDSFSDGGRALDPGRAADLALAMEAAGADLIDIGAESTRPGAPPLPSGEERARLLPVLRRLRGRITVPLSVDTYKADVARQALDEGAVIINDVSGLEYDPALGDVVAVRGAGLVLMHTRGRSAAMYDLATYDDVVAEVSRELLRRVEAAVGRGVPVGSLVLDPGLGFAKQAAHSARVLARLDEFAALGRPLLVGPSRKSFLAGAAGGRPAAERDWATAAAVTAAALGGAHIVRVHAVDEMVQAARVADLLRAEAAAGG
ncbi:MAG: dihydropteroate synthase [Vicinamibacterales bacterium]|nr:dihydropteroate synthase [Vicinamibacterales bacterium]